MVPDSSSADGGIDTVRIALIIGCVAAAIVAATVVPVIAGGGGGLAGSPLDAVLPGEQAPTGPAGEEVGLEQSDSIAGGQQSGLGALNPGERTGVGGDIGFDSDTFGSNDTEVHFVVESSEASYWRTGAYDRYTGTGWEQTGEPVAYEDPIEHDGYADQQVEYTVTLARPATGLPTVWRPRAVSGVDGLLVTDAGAIQSEQRLDDGTTFTGVSRTSERDVQVLRATGQSYPDDIERRYTQLPDDTPERVGTFTTELTSDDDSPYDTAVTIQQWLRTNKSYSLQASQQSEQMADTFIFEMEKGYCEYFATSMVTMLRSQDIPARYTVGYSTGQQVAEDTYEVRGMNAHAWVEVYFEDVGWVRFDPTPGTDRLAAQEQVLDEQGINREVVEEQGSPGETFDSDGPDEEHPEDSEIDDSRGENGETDQTGQQQDDSGQDENSDGRADDNQQDDSTGDDSDEDGQDDQQEDEESQVDQQDSDQQTNSGDDNQTDQQDDGDQQVGDQHNDPEPPYETTLNRTAVAGATVKVTVTQSGEPAVGREVLFNDVSVGITDEQGVVTGTVPYDEELRISVNDDSEPQFTSVGRLPRNSGRLYAASGTTDRELVAGIGMAMADTYPVETNATVTVSGETVPGETVTVTAVVEDVAVSDATVTVDGEAVNQTDENGHAVVGLPEEPGNVTIGVERGPVSGTTTVTLPELSLSVDSTVPLALPYTGLSVDVSAGETAVVGAPVTVDGQQVATTGPGGSVTVRLPLASDVTVGTTAHGMREETTVGGLFRNAGVVLVGLLGFTGVVFGGLSRLGYGPRTLGKVIVQLPARVVHSVQWLLVTLVTRGDVLVRRLIEHLQLSVTYLAAPARGEESPHDLWMKLRAWFEERWRRMRAGVGNGDKDSGTETSADQSAAGVTIREGWEQLLRRTSVRRVPHRTPGELARHAIEEDDLPPDAVRTLRDVFREVEYGSRPASERVERVQQAIDTIEQNDRRQMDGDA